MAGLLSALVFITMFLIFLLLLRLRRLGLALGLMITLALLGLALRVMASTFELLATLLIFLLLYLVTLFSGGRSRNTG